MADAPAVPPTPEEAAKEQAQALYDVLKPEAQATAREFIMRQTPMPLQAAMQPLVDADFPPPEVPPQTLPSDTPQFVINQMAAQKAAAEAAKAKIPEVEALVEPAPA